MSAVAPSQKSCACTDCGTKKSSSPHRQQVTPPESPGRTTTRYDAEGNKVVEASGDGPRRIRTHDYSNEDEVNEALFGKGAVAKTGPKTHTRLDADGNKVVEADGDVRVRTHDHSNEDEINERLFGKGAKRTPTNKSVARTSTAKSTTYRNADGDLEEVADGDQGLRTHDFDDQDAINVRMFGKGARNADD